MFKSESDEFNEAYAMAMEIMAQRNGGDRSHIQRSLMEHAPSMGFVIQEADVVYEGSKGKLIWDYGICNEITFKYDDDDPDHMVVLHTATNEYDAEIAFNHYYNLYRPEGEPEKNFDVLSGIEPGASL
jgi:hypothetical protein